MSSLTAAMPLPVGEPKTVLAMDRVGLVGGGGGNGADT